MPPEKGEDSHAANEALCDLENALSTITPSETCWTTNAAQRFSKGIDDPARALKIVRLRIGCYPGSRACRRSVVVARSRTSADLLISPLNSHLSVHACREIFSTLDRRSAGQVSGEAFRRFLGVEDRTPKTRLDRRNRDALSGRIG